MGDKKYCIKKALENTEKAWDKNLKGFMGGLVEGFVSDVDARIKKRKDQF